MGEERHEQFNRNFLILLQFSRLSGMNHIKPVIISCVELPWHRIQSYVIHTKFPYFSLSDSAKWTWMSIVGPISPSKDL